MTHFLNANLATRLRETKKKQSLVNPCFISLNLGAKLEIYLLATQ